MASSDSTNLTPVKQGKTIHRTPKKAGWVHVSNDLAQSKSLSLEAKGLLLFVLSLPEDWKFYSDWLRRECCSGGIGRERYQSITRELVEAGYLARSLTSAERGRFSWVYQWYGTPVSPEPAFPSTVQPSTVQPSTANPSINKEHTDKTPGYPQKKEGVPATTNKRPGGGGATTLSPAALEDKPQSVDITPTEHKPAVAAKKKLSAAQRKVVDAIAAEIVAVCNRDGRRYVLPDDQKVQRTAKALAWRANYDLVCWKDDPELQSEMYMVRKLGYLGQRALDAMRNFWHLSEGG